MSLLQRGSVEIIKNDVVQSPEVASELIYKQLLGGNPCMIARFGSTELSCIQNYLSIVYNKNKVFSYVAGRILPWWWDNSIMNQMKNWSGFYPATPDNLTKFSQLMLNDIPEVDILGSWLDGEKEFELELSESKKVNLELLNPYFSNKPWTRALAGKRVLVIHPFSKTIESQYQKRELLFKSEVLPVFELQTIKAVQSLAGDTTEFEDWFSALEYMKSEIDNREYDICLIGCGAYGFPLAAHVKRSGKKAIHLGGALQLLFGIRGARWESTLYNDMYNYAKLMNEHWVRPSDLEKPNTADNVEGACYW